MSVSTGIYRCPVCDHETREPTKCYGRDGQYHAVAWTEPVVVEEQELYPEDILATTPQYASTDIDEHEPEKPAILIQAENDPELMALLTAVFTFGLKKRYIPPPSDPETVVTLLEGVGEEAFSGLLKDKASEVLIGGPDGEGKSLIHLSEWLGWRQAKRVLEEHGQEEYEQLRQQSMEMMKLLQEKD